MPTDEPTPTQFVFEAVLGGGNSAFRTAVANLVGFPEIQPLTPDLFQVLDSIIDGLVCTLSFRDGETEEHTRRVTDLTLKIARKLTLADCALVHLRWGALLHDIGKVAVPDEILRKPGPLSEDEWQIMRMHPVFAYQIMSRIPYLMPAMEIPYCHHEKWDGSGYPRGLIADQIPLAARIFAIADVWDALTSSRPYRPAWPEQEALSYVCEQSGKHFDPDLVGIFLSCNA